MGGVDVGSGKGKRTVNSDVNMIPFIDLLMVTISFLLITAVWVTHSRIETNAQVPGPPGEGPITPPEVPKDLHVFVSESEFLLTWKQAATVVSETRVPRDGQTAYDDLGDTIVKEWALHGSHQNPSDRKRDRCVIHTDNQLPFKEMVAVMDAVQTAKRELNVKGTNQRVAAFATALASR